MALAADKVGPNKKPEPGVISKTDGSSISGPLSLYPTTRMALIFLELGSTGSWIQDHLAGTSVGFCKRKNPSHSFDTWHTLKKIPGEDAVRKGSAISAVIGIRSAWPVEKDTKSCPFSTVGLSKPLDAVYHEYIWMSLLETFSDVCMYRTVHVWNNTEMWF